jgi:hypothetical protein
MKKEEIKRFVLLAILKGLIHATVMPIAMLYLAFSLTSNSFAFLTPFAYIAIVSIIYVMSEDKDLSKMVFFRTLMILVSLILIYLLLVVS